MPFRRALIVAVAAVGIVVAAGVIWMTLLQPATGTPTIARPGAPAPQIALPAMGGGTSNLHAERGKVVLVNFWATWCEPCRAEMPELQRLADDLHDEPFSMYFVDLQEDPETIEAFLRELGLRLYVLLDDDGSVTRAYGVRALPATFLIDRQGILRQQRLGPLVTGESDAAWSEAWLAQQVRELMRS